MEDHAGTCSMGGGRVPSGHENRGAQRLSDLSLLRICLPIAWARRPKNLTGVRPRNLEARAVDEEMRRNWPVAAYSDLGSLHLLMPGLIPGIPVARWQCAACAGLPAPGLLAPPPFVTASAYEANGVCLDLSMPFVSLPRADKWISPR